MERKLSIAGGVVVIAIGIAGCLVGIARIAAGETGRGLADLIIGGFIAIYNACQLREERQQ